MGVVYGILGLQNYTEDLSVSFLVVEQHKLTTICLEQRQETRER